MQLDRQGQGLERNLSRKARLPGLPPKAQPNRQESKKLKKPRIGGLCEVVWLGLSVTNPNKSLAP